MRKSVIGLHNLRRRLLGASNFGLDCTDKFADKLRGQRAAGLRLCYRIYKKLVFSRRG